MTQPDANAPDPDLELAAYVATTFYDDPLGFVLFAFPWGEGALSGETGPDEWQREQLLRIGAKVKANAFDGVHAVEPIREAVASGHGTGKSADVSWIILWVMSTRVNAIGTVTANTATQLETKTWRELAKWLGMCITGHWFKLSADSLAHRQHPKTWRCDAVTCEERNSEAFAGQHNANSTSFYIFDEGSAIPDIIYDVAEGGLTDGEPMIFVYGNPTRNSGRFREIFGRLRHRWTTKQIDSRTTKKANKAEIARWAEDYGEDSDFFRVRVRGEFPRVGSTQFIGSHVIEAAMDPERAPHVTIMDPMVIGVDVARFGDDQSVIYFRRGHDGRTHPPLKFRGLDTMQLAARVAEAFAEFRADAIFVDETGVGAGVVDRLRQLRFPVTGVSFAAEPDRAMPAGDGADRFGYRNKRAEIYGVMRDWLRYGALPRDPELKADLENIQYGYVPYKGKDVILLEKKEDMKKRGLASPDIADALALTFAYPVAASDHSRAVSRSRGAGSHEVEYDPMAHLYGRR